MEDLREVGTNLHTVFACTFKDEDWRMASVFNMYVTHNSKSYEVIIDEYSCVTW